jgi:hypothetical protein
VGRDLRAHLNARSAFEFAEPDTDRRRACGAQTRSESPSHLPEDLDYEHVSLRTLHGLSGIPADPPRKILQDTGSSPHAFPTDADAEGVSKAWHGSRRGSGFNEAQTTLEGG